MRKVSKQAAYAFENDKKFSSGNTTVFMQNGETYLFLFNHLIARKTNSEILLTIGIGKLTQLLIG